MSTPHRITESPERLPEQLSSAGTRPPSHNELSPAMRLINLQRSVGNRAVIGLLASPAKAAISVQRCGPNPCDCSDEQREAAASEVQVARLWDADADHENAPSTPDTEPVGELDEGPYVHDGDTPPGGSVQPVPETPDELTSAESVIGDEDSSSDGTASLMVSRDRARDPAPASRRRWISRILIDLSAQTIRFEWSNGAPGASSSISSGRGRPCTASDPCANQNNRNCTPTGTFHPTFLGGPSYTNSEGDAMAWYVDLGTGRGIGIHDSQPVLGRPASHGCIRVPMGIARTINQNVIRATAVNISGKAQTVPWRDRTCPAPASGPRPAPAPRPPAHPAVPSA
jgi:hypothetical protein